MSAILADERIERLVQTIVDHLDLPLPVRLWNGKVLGNWPAFDP